MDDRTRAIYDELKKAKELLEGPTFPGRIDWVKDLVRHATRELEKMIGNGRGDIGRAE